MISADWRAIDKGNLIFSWHPWWNNSIHSHYPHCSFPKIIVTLLFTNCGLRCDIICLLNRLMFNHRRFNDHLLRLNIVNSLSYTCGVLQSPSSMCPNAGTSFRHFTLCKLFVYGFDNRIVFDILYLCNLTAYAAISLFLKLGNRRYKYSKPNYETTLRRNLLLPKFFSSSIRGFHTLVLHHFSHYPEIPEYFALKN